MILLQYLTGLAHRYKMRFSEKNIKYRMDTHVMNNHYYILSTSLVPAPQVLCEQSEPAQFTKLNYRKGILNVSLKSMENKEGFFLGILKH